MEASLSPPTAAICVESCANSAGQKVLAEVHHLVIPPIPCSFPCRNHPDYLQLSEMSDRWTLQHFSDLPGADGRPSSFSAHHLKKSAFGLLSTLTFANGLSARMPPIIKFIVWLFVYDNILDDPSEMGADLQRAETVVDGVLTVFLDTYVHPCSSPSPLVRAFTDTAAEWWAEMCVDMPPKQKGRFSKSFYDYVKAHCVQVPYRESRQLPNVETYLKMRLEVSACRLCCGVLVEYCQGLELDDEALSHPLVGQLLENTEQHVFLVNDLISFKREYMQGDFWNIVSVLYFSKLYDGGQERGPASPEPTLQAAVVEVWEMIKQKDEECVRLMGEIRKNAVLMKKPGMAKYMEGLGLWMSGSIYWHLVSGRYGGASSTANVPGSHTRPDNKILAQEHQVSIETNRVVSHIVPLGIMHDAGGLLSAYN